MRIFNNIHRVTINTFTLPPHHTTNCYIIGGDQEAVLIDPIYGLYGNLAACLKETQIRAIQYAAITHPHPDHYGGIARLLKTFGGRALCHRDMAVAKSFGVSKADSITGLRGGETIETADHTIQVLHTPGHSPAHLSFYIPAAGILFSGDAILGHGTSIISPPEGNMSDYLQTLHQLASLDIRMICPAHGPVIDRGAAERIQWYIAHRMMREARVLAALQEGLSSIKSITRRIYDEADFRMHGRGLLPRAQRSVLAHLEKLEKEGVVIRKVNGREAQYLLV